MANKTITVRFGKCTTLLVPKSWPMKAWLRDVDQWKAENLASFCNWLITRCFIENDRARLIIEHTKIFALSGNIDGPCNYTKLLCVIIVEGTTKLSSYNGINRVLYWGISFKSVAVYHVFTLILLFLLLHTFFCALYWILFSQSDFWGLEGLTFSKTKDIIFCDETSYQLHAGQVDPSLFHLNAPSRHVSFIYFYFFFFCCFPFNQGSWMKTQERH